jgi:uncharacterized membrane protein
MKKIQDLSKEELVKMLALDEKPERIYIHFVLSVLAYGVLIYFIEQNYPLGGFIHSWTLFSIVVLLVGQIITLTFQSGSNKKKLVALIQLLRKSNVIKE